MRMRGTALLSAWVRAGICSGIGLLLSAGIVHAQAINFDLKDVGDPTHAGADAVLSSAGGTTWNPLTPDAPPVTVLDEFGASVPLTLQYDDVPTAVSGSALLDSTWNAGGFIVSGLPMGYYDTVVYMPGAHSRTAVTHAGGSTAVNTNDAATGILPGVLGGDYGRVNTITPYEVSPGVLGLGFGLGGATDGSVSAVQIRPTVAQPLQATYAQTAYDLHVDPVAGQYHNESGEITHAFTTGHTKSYTQSVSVPQAVVRSEATAGLNPFGGGSMGAMSEVKQIGTRGNPPPKGGSSLTRAEFVSNFYPVAAPGTGLIDVDIHFALDGFLDILGVTDASSNDVSIAFSRVEVFASIKSAFRPEKTLFSGILMFHGSDTTIGALDDMGQLGIGSGLTYSQHQNQLGEYAGGLLEVNLDTFFDDQFYAIPGEQLQLHFQIVTDAVIGEFGGGNVEYVTSDFYNTLVGSVSTDTPGVVFEQTAVPEPSALILLPTLLAGIVRRRR